jgi:hypothetical protein
LKKVQLNQLVSKYQESRLEKDFKLILKAIKNDVYFVRAKFNDKFIALLDLDSIVYEALLKSINNYTIGVSNFDSYFRRWLSSTLTREAIKNQSGIVLPEYLAKKSFKITPELKDLMLSGLYKEEFMSVLNLSSGNYDNLVHYYSCASSYCAPDSVDNISDSDISLDVINVLDNVKSEYRKPIIMYFGLMGFKEYNKKEIYKYCGIDMNEVLEYLKDNEELINLLGGYNE